MKVIITTLILSAVLLGCKKDHSNNVVLTEKLTDCPAQTTCTYNYTDNADFTLSPFIDGQGNYRVFTYKSTNVNLCDATTILYFKTSLSNSDFDITATEVTKGQTVNYGFSCACCDVIATHTIGGEIKGKRTDATHWLINATIILARPDNTPIDTVVVNQYFTLKAL